MHHHHAHDARRQYLQNRRKLELKYKGRLDTSSGRYTHTA
jgi:hypothetical protein